MPTRLKLLQGTYRPDRARLLNEPRPEAKAPPCPDFLDADAKREWRRLVPRLEKIGLATELDGALLAVYCSAWSRACRAERMIAAQGEVIRLPNGALQKNPYLKILRDAWQTILQSAAHFGLSPSARARVHAQPPASASPLRVFVNRYGPETKEPKP